MKRFIVDGARLCNPMDGMLRVEIEILKYLDEKVQPGKVLLVVKDKAFVMNRLGLKNIKCVERRYPSRGWELINVDLFALVSNRIPVCFNNRAGYLKKGIFLLHDIIPLTYYGKETSYKNSICNDKYLKNLNRMKKKAYPLVTISEFCRDEYVKYLGIDINRIIIAKNGWDHVKDIEPDFTVFDKLQTIQKGEYYFSLGSVSPHKNFKFIYEVAKRNPNAMFVVTGAMNHGFDVNNIENTSNLIYTGRLSDQEIRALMMHCKAFIFPSFVEGFGLPPLEALSYGAKVCVSDIPVMREIFKKSVHYFDPNNYELDIEKLLKESIEEPERILSEYTWENNAKIWSKILT